ncbi:unnamed protein product [Urochloa humidicola]
MRKRGRRCRGRPALRRRRQWARPRHAAPVRAQPGWRAAAAAYSSAAWPPPLPRLPEAVNRPLGRWAARPSARLLAAPLRRRAAAATQARGRADGRRGPCPSATVLPRRPASGQGSPGAASLRHRTPAPCPWPAWRMEMGSLEMEEEK